MAGVNKVILIGNLTREPEYRQMPNGTAVVDFGMAMNRRFVNTRGEQQEDTCFVDLAAFGRTAEVVRNFCHKGDPLFIEGRLRYDQWDDKTNGAKRSRLTVVAESVELLTRRNSNAPGQPPYQGQGAAYGQPVPPQVGLQPLTPGGSGYAQGGYQQPYAQRQGGYSQSAGGSGQFAPPPQQPMPAFQSVPTAPPSAAAPENDVPVDDVPF